MTPERPDTRRSIKRGRLSPRPARSRSGVKLASIPCSSTSSDLSRPGQERDVGLPPIRLFRQKAERLAAGPGKNRESDERETSRPRTRLSALPGAPEQRAQVCRPVASMPATDPGTPSPRSGERPDQPEKPKDPPCWVSPGAKIASIPNTSDETPGTPLQPDFLPLKSSLIPPPLLHRFPTLPPAPRVKASSTSPFDTCFVLSRTRFLPRHAARDQPGARCFVTPHASSVQPMTIVLDLRIRCQTRRCVERIAARHAPQPGPSRRFRETAGRRERAVLVSLNKLLTASSSEEKFVNFLEFGEKEAIKGISFPRSGGIVDTGYLR